MPLIAPLVRSGINVVVLFSALVPTPCLLSHTSVPGWRILQRGAGALAVGWLPVIGVAADVASLSADYAGVCALLATNDELLSAMLYLPESRLYADNYCDVPEQGIEIIVKSAESAHFPWHAEESL